MTETLAKKTCTPCRGGIPPLTREEAELFHAQAPDWELRDDAHRIERTFLFRNFREAGAFVQENNELAEAVGHHPVFNPDPTIRKVSLPSPRLSVSVPIALMKTSSPSPAIDNVIFLKGTSDCAMLSP